MRKTLQTIALAALCLNFTIKAIAQTPQNKAIDVTTKGIQIGQKIPDLPNLANYKDKLIILDFWATWCSPCVAMIPKMEALQEQFKDQIQIIPVTYQSEKETSIFLNKLTKGKPSTLPHITGDKQLHRLFPHIYLPHYVWIDKGGIVKAITGSDQVTADNIRKMLKSNPNPDTINQKRDMKIAYDKTKPFLINGNGGEGSSMTYHSIFSGYVEGLNGRSAIRKASATVPARIVAHNVQMTILYGLAYGKIRYFGANRILVTAKDRGAFFFKDDTLSSDDWKRKNRYCYELILPRESGNIYQCMRQDLERILPKYTANIITKKGTCLVLVKTGNLDKIISKGDSPAQISTSMSGAKLVNTNLNELLKRLEMVYLQSLPYPLVNGTGYTGAVDMELTANMTNITSINKALSSYELKLEEMEASTEYLQISDK